MQLRKYHSCLQPQLRAESHIPKGSVVKDTKRSSPYRLSLQCDAVPRAHKSHGNIGRPPPRLSHLRHGTEGGKLTDGSVPNLAVKCSLFVQVLAHL